MGKAAGPQRWKTSPLGKKFDGDLKQLEFFLAHVLTDVQEYGHKVPAKRAKLRVVTLAIEEALAWWMVTLHNSDAPKLRNFNRFMTAL